MNRRAFIRAGLAGLGAAVCGVAPTLLGEQAFMHMTEIGCWPSGSRIIIPWKLARHSITTRVVSGYEPIDMDLNPSGEWQATEDIEAGEVGTVVRGFSNDFILEGT